MNNYIIQNMTKFLNYEHFLEYQKDISMSVFDEKITYPSFLDILKYKYLIVVAEPGYGKTRLLKQIALQHKRAFFIDSKKITRTIEDSIKNCEIIKNNLSEEELQLKSLFCTENDYTLDSNTILCFDALDELPFSTLFSFFDKIKEFILKNPDVCIFLSCRVHHLKRITYDLYSLPFEYITLAKFNEVQVINYLISCNFGKQEINEIEDKSKVTNLFKFLCIPRYLYYFSELIKNKKLDQIVKLSRDEMFEHFVYRKIDKERKKSTYSESENHTLKRVLEQLAFVMKIYQVSQISKDEFYTIFMELNLSNIFTGEHLLEKLFDKSVLKDNINYLEFENQEFLDFLASKELNRFEKVDQVFFDIAVEPHLKEVFTNWFYVMPFILEKQPFMIDIILNFLDNNSNKTLREEYFNVITSIDPKYLSSQVKSRIFNFIFNYYSNHKQWINSSKLIYFYDEKEHYQKILDSIVGDVENNIKIRNAINIIEELYNHNLLDKIKLTFWKGKFLEWLKLDIKKYHNLHSAIISSCSVIMKNNFDWIKDIRFIYEKGIEVQHEYSRTCYKISPNNIFSIDTYFSSNEIYKKNKNYTGGRIDDNIKYIISVNNYEGITYILTKLTSKESKEKLNYIFETSYRSSFNDDLKQFIKNIENILDDKIIKLLKKLVLNLLIEIRIKYNEEGKYLFNLLLKLIIKINKEYLFEFIKEMHRLYKDDNLSFWDFEEVVSFNISNYIDSSNFEKIYKELKKFENETRTITSLMCYQLFEDEKVEIGVKTKISQIYKKELENNKKKNTKDKEKELRNKENKRLGLFKQWEYKIEPEKDKFITDLFSFYLKNKEQLIENTKYEENRSKTISWAKKIIRNNNPLNGKVKVNGNSSTIWSIPYYKTAIELLYKEKVELDQILIDNIFRYLPFNINSEYELTLKIAENPSDEAIQDILEVYSNKRKDDLGIYHPLNLLEIYKNKKIKEAENLLLKMIYNKQLDTYIRKEIVDILPKEFLTKEIINKYIKDFGKNDELFEYMIITLINNFKDKTAINIAFKLVIEKAKNMELEEGKDSLFHLSLDLDRNNNILAHTLIQVNYNINKDKELLDIAMQLRNDNKNLNGYFLEKIVFEHIKYLNYNESFTPIIEIEKFIQENNTNKYIYSFEYKFKELKAIYLEKLAKPKHVMEAIKSYKKVKESEYLAISSSLHLLEKVKESINSDIKHWIEIEGAYKHINELSKKNKNKNAEDFIQKTLKSQIELSLIKRGLRSSDIRITREEQTLDDKRADFTINYGFMGTILLELKLSNNIEAGNGKIAKEYKEKLNKYIKATNSNYGLFIIFNTNKSKHIFNKQLEKLTLLYSNEENIFILGINCRIQ